MYNLFLGVLARSAESLLYLLRFVLLLLFFPRKTQRAAQTVRPRNLKLGQMVELNLRRMYQSLSPVGGATAQKKKKNLTFLGVAPTKFIVD